MAKKRSKEMGAGEHHSRGHRGRVWPQHKLGAVLEHLRGEKSVAEICRARGITQSTLFTWKEHFLAGAQEYLAHRGMSAGERAARKEVKRLARALARETLDKRIVTEALEMLEDSRWRKGVRSSK